jgi:hypothetical protein
MHLKWPWPIDKAYKVAVGQVHEVRIGVQAEDPTQGLLKEELILWTNKPPAASRRASTWSRAAST